MPDRPDYDDDDDEVDSFQESTTTGESPLKLVSKPPAYQPAYVLRQVKGPGSPCDLTLTRDEHIIGRSRGADLHVDSPELSRKHVAFKKRGNEYTVLDLGSRNGLYLNGVRIHSAVLRGGDTLQMGNVTFVYLEGF